VVFISIVFLRRKRATFEILHNGSRQPLFIKGRDHAKILYLIKLAIL
jgi:hypothetical protein